MHVTVFVLLFQLIFYAAASQDKINANPTIITAAILHCRQFNTSIWYLNMCLSRYSCTSTHSGLSQWRRDIHPNFADLYYVCVIIIQIYPEQINDRLIDLLSVNGLINATFVDSIISSPTTIAIQGRRWVWKICTPAPRRHSTARMSRYWASAEFRC